MTYFTKALPVMLFVLLLGTPTVAQNDCEKMLDQGLYENFKITRLSSFSSDFRSYLLTTTFRTDLKNGKWGGSITVPIEGVPVSLGVSASEEEMTSFQQSVQKATTFALRSDDYQSLVSSIPNVNLAEVYSNCVIGIQRTFRVIPTFGDNWASFEVRYSPISTTDPMPKVVSFDVRNGSNVKTALKLGEPILLSNLVSTDRDSKKDIILFLQTDRGVATYKIPAEPEPEIAKDMPVGTIIASYLTIEQFNFATKNNEKSPGGVWTSAKSKWCAADGRIVPNSLFQKFTSQTNVPDLRGVFLRGLNVMEAIPQIPLVSNRKDPEDNRVVGSFQQDQYQAHEHTFRAPGGGGSSEAPGNQGLSPERTTNGGGGSETRPRNIAVYYYIRIN